MKIQKFNEIRGERIDRKVYWIVPFDKSNKFEDALVQLYKQYTEWVSPIKPVSDALGLAQFTRKDLKGKTKSNYVCITLEYSIDDFTEKVVRGPNFHSYSFEEKEYLDSNGYIYVGRINIADYEWDANKYNL